MAYDIEDTVSAITEQLNLINTLAQGLRSPPRQPTLTDLFYLSKKIMSAISDFAAAQTVYNDREDAAIAGLTADVASLNAQILALQNSPGAITPADQALLDGLQARGQTIATKLEALDALTPPVVPPVSV